jgi:integrase
MANKLPSGRWRGRVVNLQGKQVAPHTIIGGPTTYDTRRRAERAEDDARVALLSAAERGTTLRDFWTDWTSSPLWARSAESTNLHNRERTRGFVERYGDRPIRSIGPTEVAEWLKDGHNAGTVPALRAMFTDAGKPQAGSLVDRNPFANLGLKRSKGRKNVQPPDEAMVERMFAAADELTPPSFAAFLLTAVWTAARPGELDALRWVDLDFTPGAECIRIERQWNVKTARFTEPKHGSRRTIAMVDTVRDRLLSLPRESEFVFTTVNVSHYTPSSRVYHWNRVRCAVGIGNVSLYLATRHWFGWYALNMLELPSHVIALQLGHTDGGRLVEQLYGHPDAAIARDRIRTAFRSTATVTPLVTPLVTAA